jgi:hypothetical protein
MTPRLAVASMFRDSQTWYGRWLDQVGRFFIQLESSGLSPFYFLVEGDSRDGTPIALLEWQQRLPGRVSLHVSNGMGGKVASVDSADRFRRLSTVGNVALDAARESGAELVLWVESDFILPPGAIARLLEAVNQPWWSTALGVCPVPTFGSPALFYDTWGFEGIDGRRWTNNEQPGMNDPARYIPLRAAGSCILFRGETLRARKYRCPDSGCLPGLCRLAVDDGYLLFCDTTVRVEHPSTALVFGRLV